MSLYNMICGVKPATFFVLPMLGEGHHPDTWPRFRDCFLGDEEHLNMLTRSSSIHALEVGTVNVMAKRMVGLEAYLDSKPITTIPLTARMPAGCLMCLNSGRMILKR